ncbi:uncharacterized protein LOC134441882 isoform X2 [Engraulis encrasicolus]|uniref:uncharacterized protein LOC134441882 isoform X2 n=1 Tax=Engraulis encrasicolus TaxID=184585 RepID=UPI002FCF6B02
MSQGIGCLHSAHYTTPTKGVRAHTHTHASCVSRLPSWIALVYIASSCNTGLKMSQRRIPPLLNGPSQCLPHLVAEDRETMKSAPVPWSHSMRRWAEANMDNLSLELVPDVVQLQSSCSSRPKTKETEPSVFEHTPQGSPSNPPGSKEMPTQTKQHTGFKSESCRTRGFVGTARKKCPSTAPVWPGSVGGCYGLGIGSKTEENQGHPSRPQVAPTSEGHLLNSMCKPATAPCQPTNSDPFAMYERWAKAWEERGQIGIFLKTATTLELVARKIGTPRPPPADILLQNENTRAGKEEARKDMCSQSSKHMEAPPLISKRQLACQGQKYQLIGSPLERHREVMLPGMAKRTSQ